MCRCLHANVFSVPRSSDRSLSADGMFSGLAARYGANAYIAMRSAPWCTRSTARMSSGQGFIRTPVPTWSYVQPLGRTVAVCGLTGCSVIIRASVCLCLHGFVFSVARELGVGVVCSDIQWFLAPCRSGSTWLFAECRIGLRSSPDGMTTQLIANCIVYIRMSLFVFYCCLMRRGIAGLARALAGLRAKRWLLRPNVASRSRGKAH